MEKYKYHTKYQLLHELEVLTKTLNKLASEEEIENAKQEFIQYNKKCRKCKQILPYTEEYFYWRDMRNRILKDCCKECSSEYKRELDRRIDEKKFRECY